jgi:outer membrane protein TolC
MKRIPFILISLLLPVMTNAQQLSLDSCLALAGRNNKQILAARAQTRQADYAVKSARANFLPDISISGNGYWNNSRGLLLSIPQTWLPNFDLSSGSPVPTGTAAYFPGLDIAYEIGTVWRGSLAVTQPIYTGGKIATGYRMARLAQQMSQTQESLSRQEIYVEVVEAYTLLVRAQEMQQVARQHHALLSMLLQNVQSAVQHGMKLANDLLKVKVRLNESELAMHRADNARRLAAKNLCQTIGIEYRETIEADTVLAQPALQGGLEEGTRPERQLMDQQVEMARRQARLALADMLPQVGIQGGYGYMYGLKVGNETVLDGGSFSVALAVNIPIFHFGGHINKVRAAEAKAEQVELERQLLDERMQLEFSQAADNLDEASLEASLAVRSLAQADENLKLSNKQYETGMESISDLLEAQTLWQQAYATMVEARCTQYLAHIRYLKAAGLLIVSD